jgi:hypothetical protein
MLSMTVTRGTGLDSPHQAAGTQVVDPSARIREGVVGRAFCPSLDITKDPIEGVSIVRDASRLKEFLARCLAPPGSA